MLLSVRELVFHCFCVARANGRENINNDNNDNKDDNNNNNNSAEPSREQNVEGRRVEMRFRR